MTFVPNPNAEREIKAMAIRNLLPTLKAEVEQVRCPEHEGHHATVVADSTTGWKIVGDCDAVVAAGMDRLVEKGLVKRG